MKYGIDEKHVKIIGRTLTDRGIRWFGASGSGIDFFLKARSAKLQSAPMEPEAAWRKAVTSSTLWLVGGIVLIAFYLSGARAGVVTIDTGVMILLVLIGCYCLYLASALGKLWKQKPGPKGKKK